MAASKQTVADIHRVMSRYVNSRLMGQCLLDLNKVQGNKSFQNTMNALCRYHFDERKQDVGNH